MQPARSHRVPVSCRSCRAKKLRCNKIQPCSNCTTRGIECHFVVPPLVSSQTNRFDHERDDLSARVKRLERIIENLPATVPTTETGVLSKSPEESSNVGLGGSEDVVAMMQDEDAQSLENVGTRDNTILPTLAGDLYVEVKGIDEMLAQLDSSQYNAGAICLPIYHEAVIMLQSYESSVDHVYRILHLPTLRAQMRSCYLALARTDFVSSSQLALLAAIFALAAFFHNPLRTGQLIRSEKDSISLAKALSKSTLNALDHSRRTTSGSVEDVQAYILASIVTYYLDGFSARGRLLSSTAIAIARDLGLHRLDAARDTQSRTESTGSGLIELEVKRRVFWHVTSTDWLLSMASGPQEGTYVLHANHINVQIPKNCSDDTLGLNEIGDAAAALQPTGMTYFLERVRLGQLCRWITDTVPVDISSLLRTSYDVVVTADEHILEFLSTLPYFFRLDAESRSQAAALEGVYPTLGLLRYLITQAAHSRRCKLHQKFLLRQSVHPRYAYSRQACLDSARIVIRSFEDLAGGGCSLIMVARMGLAVHFLHLALAVFVLDLCCNRSAPDRTEIEAELRASFYRLEGLQHASVLLQGSLTSLHRVLYKHGIHIDTSIDAGDLTSALTVSQTQANPPAVFRLDTLAAPMPVADFADTSNVFDIYLGHAWDSVPQLDLNEDGWDDVFGQFDKHLI